MEKIEKKVIATDNKILKWIEKNILPISFILISILGFLARMCFINIESGEYEMFLQPWFEELKANGGLAGLDNYTGNYNYPYITIMAILTYLPIKSVISIKMVSIIFDFILAITCSKIIRIIFKKDKNVNIYSLMTYGLTLFLPTVILNSSNWAQCDCIYATFVIIAILNLLKEKYLKAFIYLGVAFAFKLQFILILPVFIFVYASKKKFPLYYFLIIPLMNIILSLPAIISGVPVSECFSVYFEQFGTYNEYISMLFPGVYNIIMMPSNDYVSNTVEGLGTVLTIITMTILAVALIIIIYKKINLKNEMIIYLSLWSVLICAFLLPNMHERYLFMGDVLSVLYFVVSRNWKKIYIPIGVSLVSLYGYVRLLFGGQILDIQMMSILNLILVVLVTKDVFQRLLKE